MQAVCSRCSTPNPLGSKICSYCGTSLPVAGQMEESRASSTGSKPPSKWLISGAVFLGISLLGLVVSLILTPFSPAWQEIATPIAVTQAIAAPSSDTPQPPPPMGPTDTPVLPPTSEPSDTPEIARTSESSDTPAPPSTTELGDTLKAGSVPSSTPTHQPTATISAEPTGSAKPAAATPAPTSTRTPAASDTPPPTEGPEPVLPQAKAPQRQPGNPRRDTRLAQIGEQVSAGTWLFTVTGVQWRKTLHWHEWSREATGVWAVLLLDIQNQASGPTSFRMPQWELYGARGGSYDESSTHYASWQFGGRDTAYTELKPGQRAQIVMAFDVAEGGKGLVLHSDRLGRGVVYIGDAQPPQDR